MRASRPLVRTLAPPFIAGLLHAVLMACAFPPLGWWPLAFIAVVPLVWAVVRAPKTSRPWLVPLMVWAGVVPLWAYEQVWIIDVSKLGYYPFIAALAAFAVLFVWLLRRMVRRWPQ